MIAIQWLDEPLLVHLHRRAIERFGGSQGVLSRPLLQSALDRPRNRATYDVDADLFDMAAAYGYGIVKNHPFIDGNKRTAMLAMATFLIQNGVVFDPDDDDAVETMVATANDTVNEASLARWLRLNSR